MRWAMVALALWACHKDKPAPASCDLSTDEAVAREYHRLTAKDLPSGPDKCIQRSQSFPGLIYLGGFASDAGCEWFGALYHCKYGNGDQLQPDVLIDAGWSHGDGALRRALIMKWLSDGQGPALLETAPAAFAKAGKPFAAPEATSTADGGVKVVYWAQASSGKAREVTFQHFEYAIGPTAIISTSSMTESFTAAP